MQENLKLTNTSSKQPKFIFEEVSAENNIIIEYDGSSDTLISNYLAFYSGTSGWSTKGSSLNIIPYNGRVGIGTISPQSILDVNGSLRASYDADTTSYIGRAAVGYTGNSDTASFCHIDYNNTTSYGFSQNNTGDSIINCHTGRSVYFRNANSEAMLLNSTGLGIGKTNPSYKLDVVGDINFTGTLYQNGGSFSVSHKTTFNVTVSSKSSNHPYSGSGSGSGYYIDGQESPKLFFRNGNTYRFNQSDGSNGSHPLRFYFDPAKSSIYSTNVVTSGTPGSSGAYVEITITDSTPIKLYYQCQNHSYMGNFGVVEITVDNLTTTEISYLDGVTSSIQTQINNNASSSDDRVKHNEVLIENPLEDLRKLKPMKYFKTENLYDANHNFNLDESNNPIDESGNLVEHVVEIGLIAQDLLKIDNLSFCVTGGGNNSPYAVRYNNIFVLAIAALQDLDEKNKKQSEEINNKMELVNSLNKELKEEKDKVFTLQSQMKDLIHRVQNLESKS